MNASPNYNPLKPQVLINNVDQDFFIKNDLDTAEVVTLLKNLPVPRYVRKIVLDGETTGEQRGEKTTRHPMIYALNVEERKVPVFISSKGRKTRNIGAKRVLEALRLDKIAEVISL